MGQQCADRSRSAGQDVLLARMAAVVHAQQAVLDHEPGGREALRGALVDVAAIAELLADELD